LAEQESEHYSALPIQEGKGEGDKIQRRNKFKEKKG